MRVEGRPAHVRPVEDLLDGQSRFEIVATTVIASLVFGERHDRRLWVGVGTITAACALLSVEDAGALRFSTGSVLVLAAATCWGLENNCTHRISDKDPVQIVIVKGLGSGAGALVVASLAGERMSGPGTVGMSLLLGFLAYGLSITLYVAAQRRLGAARTAAFYAVTPFIGAGLSRALFRTAPGAAFLLAVVLMAAGSRLVMPRRDPRGTMPG